jgi:hypothetical protein
MRQLANRSLALLATALRCLDDCNSSVPRGRWGDSIYFLRVCFFAQLKRRPNRHAVFFSESFEAGSRPSSFSPKPLHFQSSEVLQRWPAQSRTSCFRIAQTCSNTFTDQTSLQFRHAGKDREHHFSGRCASVNVFRKRNEFDSKCAEGFERSQGRLAKKVTRLYLARRVTAKDGI